MANEHDGAILARLFAVQEDPASLVEFLEREAWSIRDPSAYWLAVVSAWVKSGRAEYQDRYRKLLSVPRRNRIRGMKKASRRAYYALPREVVAYRAIAPGEDPDRALSWSLDCACIARLYPARAIIARRFAKRDIAFYTDRRGERELIVLDASLGQPLREGG